MTCAPTAYAAAAHDLRTDGVRGGGSNWVTISDNTFHDFKPKVGDHADAIQFWTTQTTASVHDIVVTGNLIYRGNGAVMQGVFLGDEVAGLYYDKVTITGNLMSGTMYHGINVSSGRDVTIHGNIVQGFSDMKSWIMLENVKGAVITDNETNLLSLKSTTNVTQSGNVLIPQATDGGAAVLAQWLGAASSGGESGAGTGGLPEEPSSMDLSDTLQGTAGDVLTGGDGDDVYVLAGKATVVEAEDGGVDTVQVSTSFTLPSNVENLELTGTAVAWGSGNALDNVVTGNANVNHLLGRAGADILLGEAGADTLNGGAGADRLTGGSDVDRFVFTRGDGIDRITDFGSGGEHDILDLSGFLSVGLKPTLSQTDAGVVVSFSSGDQILVENIQIADLHAIPAGYVF
jgi:Ca2+-binding RTX toxin-like protein